MEGPLVSRRNTANVQTTRRRHGLFTTDSKTTLSQETRGVRDLHNLPELMLLRPQMAIDTVARHSASRRQRACYSSLLFCPLREVLLDISCVV